MPTAIKYDGSWKDGQRNGMGTATYPDGTVYTGSFADGLRDGTGKITMPDGFHL